MPQTNFPSGVSSYGGPVFQGSIYDAPPGEVLWVGNGISGRAGDGSSRDRPLASIADAFVKITTTSGLQTFGAIVYVLPGHAENVTGADIYSGSSVNTTGQQAPAGTRVIGLGYGNNRPTLTFTAAASTITLANAGVSFENFVIKGPQTGTATCAALFTVTGATCAVVKCDMNMGASGTALCTTGITLGTNATKFVVTDCEVFAAAAATPTSWIQFTNTNAPARCQVLRNNVTLVLSSATGAVVDCSGGSGTAPLGWYISDNNFNNYATNSTVALKGVAGCTGTVAYNNLGITNATGGATAINTPGSWNMSQNFGGVSGKQGIAITPASG